jgi:hypothetical protein
VLLTGAAAVANIAAPRSAVATPIIRSTTGLQSAAGTQLAAKYVVYKVYNYYEKQPFTNVNKYCIYSRTVSPENQMCLNFKAEIKFEDYSLYSHIVYIV